MDLQKASNALYDIIAIDTRLRKEILRDMVSTDLAVCMLLSIRTHYSMKVPKITRLGVTENYKEQVHAVLHDIEVWDTLGIKEQIVLKEILNPKSAIFSSTVFYSYAKNVYTKEEIENELYRKVLTLKYPYVLLPAPTRKGRAYYSKTRINGRVSHSDIPKSFPIFYTDINSTIIVATASKHLIGRESVQVGNYLQGKSMTYGKLSDAFKYKDSIAEIQSVVNNKSKPYVALVFTPTGPEIIEKALESITCDILELSVDELFVPNGVWIVYNGVSYLIKGDIPNRVSMGNIHKFEVVIECSILHTGKLKQLRLIKFVRKDNKDDND